MYLHKYSVNQNEAEVHEFIRQNGFGILVTNVDGKPWATHTPMILSNDGKYLTGHVSRANAQGRVFRDEPEVLAIFQGPHTYISSSWYDHENVPTWNYIIAHAYGKIKIIEGDELFNSLKDLVYKYEKHSARPVSVEGMSPDYVAREMRGIVGFSIEISNIEASYKLSQNRDDKNYKEIIRQLKARGDHQSLEIAKKMENLRKKIKV
ncbi:MAG: FMN-binding negative transcriptional regulator [Flammeovirgaceae bacterium]|nr:FMN-binding negative transcriptional regulator [Flammeovirgaceae bacterium]